MARLSDVIRQGKVPEKEVKSVPTKKDEIRIREIEELKTKKEAVAEEKRTVTWLEEGGFPSETGVKKEEKKAATGLENMGLPSETRMEMTQKVAGPVSERPLLKGETLEKEGIFVTEAEIITCQEEQEEKARMVIYDEIYDFLDGVFKDAKADQRFSVDRGLELITRIIDTPDAIENFYRKAIYRKNFKYDSKVHGINVAIFALKIGQGLGYKREQLVELGLAALIHDIGMCKIPEYVVNKEGVLSNDEYALIKKHPRFGYEIVINYLGEKYKWLADVVAQEQEREGGQGYPRGLMGNEICEYAKVIGMVDVYEALSHSRPQRKKFLPYEATKVIVNSSKNMFHPRMIKMLITKLSCFPIGSYVVLNSKAIGRVIETNESSPLRPTVEILYDGMGKKLAEKKTVKLQEMPLLYIIDSIFEEDLPR